jgi:hypothetical protein
MSDVIPPRRRRFVPLVVVTGVAATLLLAFATTGALSGFTASINNSTNTASSGTLLMTETQGGVTCLSSASGAATISTNAGTCATINKFSGATTMVPGGTPVTASVTITNNGTVPANTFTLTPAGCTATPNVATTASGTDTAGFCGKMDITIADTTNSKCVFPASTTACAAPTAANNLTSLGTTAITLAAPLAAGASRSFTFTLQLDGGAGTTNADQGLTASEPLLWSFAS